MAELLSIPEKVLEKTEVRITQVNENGTYNVKIICGYCGSEYPEIGLPKVSKIDTRCPGCLNEFHT